MTDNPDRKNRNTTRKWMKSIFFNPENAIVCVLSRAAVAFCLFVLAGCGETASHDAVITEAMTHDLKRFVQDIHGSYPLPGIALTVVDRDHEEIFCEGVAHAGNTTFSDTTVFYSGNISELMVATTILRLADAGKISLNDPIVKHLPYFKLAGNGYQSITIQHMLTHSSGIPHHSVIFDPPTYDDRALETTTRSIEFQEPDFAAGTKIKRSPYNFDILADLVGKVTGEPFEVYANKNVLEPLGMKRSTFAFLDVPSNNLARPHQISDWLSYSFKESSAYPYSREHAGSRGFHTTLQDMNQWIKMMIHEGKVNEGIFLQEKTIQTFFKRYYKVDTHHFTGIAWEIEEVQGKTRYRKDESGDGFSTSITLLPLEKFGMLSVTNISGEFDASFVTHQMMKFVTGKPLSRVKIPVSIMFSRKVAATQNLDSAFAWYEQIKDQPEIYALSEEELSQPGVNLLYRLNRPKDAVRVFEFCLKNFPDSPTSYLNLAEAHLLQEALDEAATALAKAKELHPAQADVLARIAFVEERLKVGKEKASLISTVTKH